MLRSLLSLLPRPVLAARVAQQQGENTQHQLLPADFAPRTRSIVQLQLYVEFERSLSYNEAKILLLIPKGRVLHTRMFVINVSGKCRSSY